MTYYPSCLNQDEYCKLCNLAQLTPDGCTSTSVANSASGTKPACSTYCNTGCNSECNQPQTVCVIMGQYIKDHADVGGYNGSIINKDDFIHEKWTADYWNTLISKLNTAERVGRLSSHGSGGSVTAGIGAPYFQTAALYNQVNAKICNFNTSYATVNVNDLITASLANAIGTALKWFFYGLLSGILATIIIFIKLKK